MASHVPLLAVRPDEQSAFDTDMVKTRDFGATNGLMSPPSTMDDDFAEGPEAPMLPRVPPATRLPAAVRFPLVVLLSLSLSTLFYSLTADWIGVELAAISRTVEDEWQVGTVVAWKLAELSVAWYAGYDYKDLASLSCLSNLPYYFLLHTFYELHGLTCATALAIDMASIALPFALLRPLIHAHEPGRSPNQQVAHDPTISALMAVLGAAIYAVVVYGSLFTWLPAHLVFHFDHIRSVQHAHDATLHLLLGILIVPVGVATTHFLFTPAIGARGNPGITDPKLKPEAVRFDPEEASFAQTMAFNLGYGPDGFTKRGEVLAKRAAVLVACSAGNTLVRVLTTIDGTEPVGAVAWAGVWGLAATLTALAYGWAGNE
ncbi:hypothetical protein LTR08_003535 [Meristemomyces frigidus]|nr:hypothetical protein LTR08_003535 [Meristemomyces frigidus]